MRWRRRRLRVQRRSEHRLIAGLQAEARLTARTWGYVELPDEFMATWVRTPHGYELRVQRRA